MRHSLLLVLLSLALVACGPKAPRFEVAAAHVIGKATNTAIDELAAVERAEGMAEINASSTAKEAQERLVQLEERWAPIWAAVDAFREAHGDYADALEGKGSFTPQSLLPMLRASYCTLRREARMSATMPDFPGEPCP